MALLISNYLLSKLWRSWLHWFLHSTEISPITLLRYYGVLSPHAKYRSKIVPTPKNDNTASEQKAGGVGTKKRRYYSFAELLKRTFAIDILVCVRCGAKMAVKCIVEDVRAITATLVALEGMHNELQSNFPLPEFFAKFQGW